MENYLYVIGQNSAPAKKDDVPPPSEPLLKGYQWALLIALIALVIFYVVMKKKGKM